MLGSPAVSSQLAALGSSAAAGGVGTAELARMGSAAGVGLAAVAAAEAVGGGSGAVYALGPAAVEARWAAQRVAHRARAAAFHAFAAAWERGGRSDVPMSVRWAQVSYAASSRQTMVGRCRSTLSNPS